MNRRSDAIERRRMEAERGKRKLITAMVVFVILVSLGFPGKYTELFGGGISSLAEYGSFLIQILMMALADGDGILDGKILDLKSKYGGVYLMAGVFFLDSMLVTRYPKEQMISCVRYTTTILFALWMTDHYEPEQILHRICFAQMIFVIFVLAFIVLKPNSAFVHEVGDHDFVGILETKNNAGAELSLGILLELVWMRMRLHEKKEIPRWSLLILMIQMGLSVLCNATGAIFCSLLPGFYLFVMEKRLGADRRISLGVFYIVASVGFLITALTILPMFAPFFYAIGKDPTITGRVPLWRQAVHVMSTSHTFTGYGFGMFWRDRSAVARMHTAFRRNSFMGTMTTGCHNVLLEFWLNVGLFGVASYFVALLWSMSGARRMTEQQYAFSASFLLWFLIMGLTERSMSTYEYQTLFLFLTMGVGCNKQAPERNRRNYRRQIGQNAESIDTE